MGAIDGQLERPDSQPEDETEGVEEVVVNAERIAKDAFKRLEWPEPQVPTEAEQVLKSTESIVDAEFDRLTQAEQPELLIKNSAYSKLAAYESVEDFEQDINNFLMFFQGGIGEFYRLRPCWGRFEFLHQELAESLCTTLANYEGDFYNLPRETKEQVFEAYSKMAELVDERDPHVLRILGSDENENGEVDPYYLNR